MKRGNLTPPSEATLVLGSREWTVTGWPADLPFGIPLVAGLAFAVVGVVTVVRWLV